MRKVEQKMNDESILMALKDMIELNYKVMISYKHAGGNYVVEVLRDDYYLPPAYNYFQMENLDVAIREAGKWVERQVAAEFEK